MSLHAIEADGIGASDVRRSGSSGSHDFRLVSGRILKNGGDGMDAETMRGKARVELAAEAGTPDWLQALDHTADAGIVVTAPDLKVLFERAAWGMFTVITDPATVRLETASKVAVDAPDRVALLVRWLSELNYRHITRHELFARFNILELSQTRLVGEVQGEPIDPARHAIHTEIKAVTFHGLKIEQEGTVWRAQVIFDL